MSGIFISITRGGQARQRVCALLFLLLPAWVIGILSQPICRITYYDEFSGLSHRRITQGAQDADGLVWLASWNGLNRFDGYEFLTIYPHDNPGISSDRIRDIRRTEDGLLLCRIEEAWYVFDTERHTFEPYPDKSVPRGTPYNLEFETIGGLRADDLVFARRDRFGTIWAITRSGHIYHADDEAGRLEPYGEKIESLGNLYFSFIDRQGNVWLRNGLGVVKLSFGRHPYRLVDGGEVRSAFQDSDGRLWLGRRGGTNLPIQGTAYCMASDKEGGLWVGSKPDGLYRLSLEGGLARVAAHFRHDAGDPTSISSDTIYDILADRRGRLWIATMGGGLNLMESPTAAAPTFINSTNGMAGYPDEASKVRRLAMVGDSILMLATTQGLSVMNIEDGTFHFHDGCGPIMDVMAASDGNVYVATESRGVLSVRGASLLDDSLEFSALDAPGLSSSAGTVMSLFEYDGRVWAVCEKSLTVYDPVARESVVYVHNYWKRKLRFSEGRPLRLADGRWLLGVQEGAIILSLDSMETASHEPWIAITSLSVNNRADSIPAAGIDTLVMAKDERHLTIRFAALDFEDVSGIRYAFRTDTTTRWTDIGMMRYVAMTDMKPGEHLLELRSTDNKGQWQANHRRLVIMVTPQWWETTWAYTL